MATGKKKKKQKKLRRGRISTNAASIKRSREFAFAMAYLDTFNATKAAKKVGLKHPSIYGPKFFRRPYVQLIIQDELIMRTKSARVTSERVVNEMAALAFSSMTDFASWNGSTVSLTDSEEITRTQARAVQSVSSTMSAQGTPNVRIKLYDKAKALEMLAKYLGIFPLDGGGTNKNLPQQLATRVREFVAGASEKSGESGKPLARKVAEGKTQGKEAGSDSSPADGGRE